MPVIEGRKSAISKPAGHARRHVHSVEGPVRGTLLGGAKPYYPRSAEKGHADELVTVAPAARISAIARSASPGFRSIAATASASMATSNPASRAPTTDAR